MCVAKDERAAAGSKKSRGWQKKKEAKIAANDGFGKLLQQLNLALRLIMWEICSNTYSDWKERNAHYNYEVCSLVRLGHSDKTYHTINIYTCTHIRE